MKNNDQIAQQKLIDLSARLNDLRKVRRLESNGTELARRTSLTSDSKTEKQPNVVVLKHQRYG